MCTCMCELYKCFHAHFLHGEKRFGKTPTTNYRLAALAATVDGGIGALCGQYSRPGDTSCFSPYVKECI